MFFFWLKLTPLEIAKFNWISIYALNSLYFGNISKISLIRTNKTEWTFVYIVYLKNSGATLKDHPLMPELVSQLGATFKTPCKILMYFNWI